MGKKKVIKNIENAFKKQIASDKKVKNSYLLVYSDKLNININIAEGETANFKQPNYMASVGKIFTSVIISILYENGKLTFEDKINKYLDKKIMSNLHIYKGVDYSDEIQVKHLLNQTSGLNDVFYSLLNKVIEDPEFKINPREAIEWSKENSSPCFPPGKKMKYTDTNYYLLGLIIENITGLSFAEALKKFIFIPCNMNNSYMLGFSEPLEKSEYKMADFFYKNINLSKIDSYPNIDYAGGAVVATMEDLLKFMKAIVNNKIIKKETFDKMKEDSVKFTLGMDYGYGVWQIKTVPVIMPEMFNSWGCYGATGAYMFYHPKTESYIIGNFNDFSYKTKGLRFMMLKIIKNLCKIK